MGTRQESRQRRSTKRRSLLPHIECVGLQALPTEMLVAIASFLHPESRAALALACRRTLSALGHQSLHLQGDPRFRLLQLVERDGIFPSDILCPWCRVFHDPLLSFGRYIRFRGGAKPDRPCVTSPAEGSMVFHLFSSPFAGDAIHANTVAAVMRSHRHGSSAHGPNLLSATHRWPVPGVPVPMSRASCVIARGHCIFKTELFLLTPKSPSGSLNGLGQLHALLYRRRACRHVTWTCAFPSLSSSPGTRTAPAGQWCQRKHARPCDRGLATADPKCEEPYCSGGPAHCHECYTDCAFHVRELPRDQGRVLVLTTWKDLGAGESADDPRWMSHTLQGRPSQQRVGTRDPIWTAVEGPAKTGGPAVYGPELDAEVIEAFSR